VWRRSYAIVETHGHTSVMPLLVKAAIMTRGALEVVLICPSVAKKLGRSWGAMMKLAVLFLFSILLASGQVAFKFAAIDIKARIEAIGGLWAYASLPLFAALVIYAGATALWVWILTDTPLSRAYPFALLGAIFVPAASVVLFGESLSWSYPVGLLLVCLGVYLCVR